MSSLFPWMYENLTEAGCDEAGYGCLAGSVYAAASVLAKTYRDDYMHQLHREFPVYDWNKNKGYPTKKHRWAISEHGISPHHRLTFNLLGEKII